MCTVSSPRTEAALVLWHLQYCQHPNNKACGGKKGKLLHFTPGRIFPPGGLVAHHICHSVLWARGVRNWDACHHDTHTVYLLSYLLHVPLLILSTNSSVFTTHAQHLHRSLYGHCSKQSYSTYVLETSAGLQYIISNNTHFMCWMYLQTPYTQVLSTPLKGYVTKLSLWFSIQMKLNHQTGLDP